MGDIADMILEGILDEETGEYIGDVNEEKYGEEAPGFPISYERDKRQSREEQSVHQEEQQLISEIGKLIRAFEQEVGRKVHNLAIDDKTYGISYVKHAVIMHRDKQL